MNCLSTLLMGAVLGAGVEFGPDDNPAETPQVSTSALEGPALNLADAFKVEAKPVAKKPKKPAPLKRRVLVFKAVWCGACSVLDREWPQVRQQKLRVGSSTTDHFQMVDADRRPDLMQKHRVALLPTIILMDGDRELSRHTFLSARQLVGLHRKKASNE